MDNIVQIIESTKWSIVVIIAFLSFGNLFLKLYQLGNQALYET